ICAVSDGKHHDSGLNQGAFEAFFPPIRKASPWHGRGHGSKVLINGYLYQCDTALVRFPGPFSADLALVALTWTRQLPAHRARGPWGEELTGTRGGRLDC